jgi:hypothetical protein
MKTMISALLIAVILAGCATAKIDWSARIGNYTYDQAVTDFGPPNKSSKLSDGSTAVEWMTERSQTSINAEPASTPSHPEAGPNFMPGNPTAYFPGRYLQLTFDADGKLKTEREYSK